MTLLNALTEPCATRKCGSDSKEKDGPLIALTVITVEPEVPSGDHELSVKSNGFDTVPLLVDLERLTANAFSS